MSPKAPQVHLRRMTLADLPQVEALDRSCFRNPWPEDSFRYELRPDSTSICLVAELDEAGSEPQIVGMVVVWLIADMAEVATLAVAPQERGRGVGRRLLASALRLAWEAGARKSILEVRVSNTAALHLYYGLGYQPVGLRPGYYEDTHEDALLLTLDPLDPLALQALEKA